MPDLHAPDPTGAAAHKAAMLVSRMDFHLLRASSPEASREERSESLVWVFKRWRPICRQMEALARTAPKAVAQGYAEDDRLQDYIEARAEKSA